MQKKILLVSTLALGLATSAAFASGGTPIAPCPANSFTPGIIVGLQAGFVDTGWESMEGGNWNTAGRFAVRPRHVWREWNGRLQAEAC